MRIATSALAPLLTAILAAGCSSRPDPQSYTLRVESTRPGTEYALTGSVDIDGKRQQVEQRTPFRLTATALTINASLVSRDPDCQLIAGYIGGQDRELTKSATGPHGCQVTLIHEVREKNTRVAVDVVPLPDPAPAPVAADPAPRP